MHERPHSDFERCALASRLVTRDELNVARANLISRPSKTGGDEPADVQLASHLVEAGVLSMVGGMMGILLGAVGARVISIVAQNAGQEFQALVSLRAVLVATLFSAGVGLFFGIYPARRASLLNPIDALRYE